MFAVIAFAVAAVACAGCEDYMRGYRESRIVFERELADATLARAGESRASYEAELRQMLEARSYVRTERGLEPLDVEAELERLRAQAGARYSAS